MLISLTSEEHTAINKIVSYDLVNYDIITATVLTVMYSNEFFRPREDLMHVLSLVPGLLNISLLTEKVSFLISEELLKTSQIHNIEMCTIVNDLPSRLATKFNDKSIKSLLEKSKRKITFLINHGRLSNGKGFINHLNYMAGAQRSIVFPMLATHPILQPLKLLKKEPIME